jgi:GxxExxY protein
MNDTILNKNITYTIIGRCMEVHNFFGKGCSEVIYKDALEVELKNHGLSYEREVKYTVEYKGKVLPHYFVADFVVNGEIILEAKAVNTLKDEHLAQTINYLKISNKKLGLIVNFGSKSLQVKRVIL